MSVSPRAKMTQGQEITNNLDKMVEHVGCDRPIFGNPHGIPRSRNSPVQRHYRAESCQNCPTGTLEERVSILRTRTHSGSKVEVTTCPLWNIERLEFKVRGRSHCSRNTHPVHPLNNLPSLSKMSQVTCSVFSFRTTRSIEQSQVFLDY